MNIPFFLLEIDLKVIKLGFIAIKGNKDNKPTAIYCNNIHRNTISYFVIRVIIR